ncbi:MAG: hypothetical protein WCK76_12130 [Elusimicrobiota bacterium]
MKGINIAALAVLAAAGAWIAPGRSTASEYVPPAGLRDAAADNGGQAMQSLPKAALEGSAAPKVTPPSPKKGALEVPEHKVLKIYSNKPLPEATVAEDKKNVFVWSNPECQNKACEVKAVRFASWDYRITAQGELSFASGFSAHYRTDKVESLEKYGFVQWIKGCVFDSEVENGKLKYSHTYSRPYWQHGAEEQDHYASFHHPVLALDSVDADPVYASSPGVPHPGGYKWNRVRGSIANGSMVRYFNEQPVMPELYVTDYPSTSFTYTLGGAKVAKNTSLTFRTCLYRIADIPKVTAPETEIFPGALVCYDWSSSHIYNHASKVFEAWDRLHPECARSLAEIETEKNAPVLQGKSVIRDMEK